MRISFKTAKLAEEKGYSDHNCRCGGFPDCICDGIPLQTDLQKWLRESKKIRIFVENKTSGMFGFVIHTATGDAGVPWERHSFYTYSAETYEQALETGLRKGLEFITL